MCLILVQYVILRKREPRTRGECDEGPAFRFTCYTGVFVSASETNIPPGPRTPTQTGIPGS